MPIKNFSLWCEQKGLSDGAIKEIKFIRESEPSRRVKSGTQNVSGFYPSKKMGVTIQFESRMVELAAIYEKEHDPDVLEYYDQPPSFPLKYQINGKTHGHRYTPDYFVIETGWIGWEEWKTEEEMIKLAEKYPHRFSLNEDGVWISPPAEEYAKRKGLSFRIRTSRGIDWTYQRNIRFLEDYLQNEEPFVPDESKIAIQALVNITPGVSLDELLRQQEDFSADDLYTMIALNDLYIDLYKTPIPEYDLVKVYSDEQTAQTYQNIFQSKVMEKRISPSMVQLKTGRKVQWDGRAWELMNIGETKISLMNEEGTVIEIPEKSFKSFITEGKIKGIYEEVDESNEEVLDIIRTANEKELKAANEKYRIVRQIIEGQTRETVSVSDRTLRNWVKKFRHAEKVYGNGYIGLITQNHKKGNKNRKLPKETTDLMKKYITDEYETLVQKNKSIVYYMFCNECKEKGIPEPSFRTFCHQVDKRSIYEQTRKRKGRKAASQKEVFFWYLEETTPRHGDRPFEIAHMDHTKLDIEILCSTTGKNLGRPWATFMVDAFCRRILAAYITFDAPSYRSNMMTSRECVKRHGRLPKILVVDGGKDFQSTYFETFLAYHDMLKQQRPASKPRFGFVCERLFGTTNKGFIHNLAGNTQIMTNVRQVSKEVNPKKLAVWPLPVFAEYFYKWVYEIYDTMEHSTLGESPKDAYLHGIAKSGKREFTYTAYDELFQMMTLPTTKKGTAKVQPGQGVKINRIYYWSNVLNNPEVEGKQVEVRYDPFNMGFAYAYINKRWIKLNSEYQLDLINRTEKEIQISFEELRKRHIVQGQNVSITTKKLVEFLRSAQAEEKLQLQRLKDQETKKMLKVIEGGKSKTKEDKAISPENSRNPKPTHVESNHQKVKKNRTVYGRF